MFLYTLSLIIDYSVLITLTAHFLPHRNHKHTQQYVCNKLFIIFKICQFILFETCFTHLLLVQQDVRLSFFLFLTLLTISFNVFALRCIFDVECYEYCFILFFYFFICSLIKLLISLYVRIYVLIFPKVHDIAFKWYLGEKSLCSASVIV